MRDNDNEVATFFIALLLLTLLLNGHEKEKKDEKYS